MGTSLKPPLQSYRPPNTPIPSPDRDTLALPSLAVERLDAADARSIADSAPPASQRAAGQVL